MYSVRSRGRRRSYTTSGDCATLLLPAPVLVEAKFLDGVRPPTRAAHSGLRPVRCTFCMCAVENARCAGEAMVSARKAFSDGSFQRKGTAAANHVQLTRAAAKKRLAVTANDAMLAFALASSPQSSSPSPGKTAMPMWSPSTIACKFSNIA